MFLDEHQRYLGVLALLAEFAVYLDEEDRERVEMALDDAGAAGAITFRQVGNRFEIEPARDPA